MAFQVSPGVLVKEIDLTNVVPAVATSIGAIAGAFVKGPVGEIIPIGSEGELVDIFGKPNSDNFETWFTAANFLQYGNALRVVRADTGELNATADSAGLAINNDTVYEDNYADGSGSVGSWASRTPGTWGNSLGVSVCSSAAAFEATATATVDGAHTAGATTLAVTDGTEFQVGDIIYLQETDGTQYEITAISTDDLTIRQLDNPNGGGLKSAMSGGEAIRRRWRFYDLFDGAPGTSTWATNQGLTAAADELHVVVYDTTGDIRGFSADVAGQRTLSVIETFPFVSKHPNARTPQGGSNYYVNAVNVGSRNVFWMDHPTSGTD